MDFEYLASRLGLDKEDFLELSELFVTTTQTDLDKIRSAMADDNAMDAAAAAHSIKGAAANLGFEAMAELAKIMEFKGKDGSLEGYDAHVSELEGHVQALGDEL